MSEPESKWNVVEASSLKRGPIQHEVLPQGFVVRARLVHVAIGETIGAPVGRGQVPQGLRVTFLQWRGPAAATIDAGTVQVQAGKATTSLPVVAATMC